MERSQYLAQALQALMARPDSAPAAGLPTMPGGGQRPAANGVQGVMNNLQRLGGRLVPGRS